MLAAEFEAKVENGKIAIPEQYQDAFGKLGNARVILLKPDTPEASGSNEDIIQHLLDNPLTIENFIPASREAFYDR